MKLGIVRLYMGQSGKFGYYNIQELGLAKALANNGIKSDIFFLNENKYVEIKNINENIRIIYIPAKKVCNHGIVNPKFLLDYNIDFVHLLSDNQLMAPSFIRFCSKNKIPMYNYVGTIYSDTNNVLKKWIMNIISKRNIKYFKESRVIAKTPTIKNILESKGVKNIEVIPVGLDLDLIPKINESKEQLREKLQLPKDKKILIFVGRFEEYKNPVQALEILNELNKISRDYYLVMIGSGSLKNQILNKIQEFNLNNITIIDKVQNKKIHEYYRACDIFINLNSKEIFGMSILEAMYNECQVMAIKAPGPDYIIKNNISGFIFDSYKEMIEMIISDKQLQTNDIKIRIENKFIYDTIVDEIIFIIKSNKLL
ncbi:MAG: glycosyltransferase family 4 protein [Clostridium butyricum]|nr:glycosyltransferase family 4 protein [Clostridium butyricum]MDU5821069.1 glycosyltransferase family 4 protein [Clostridium butyricum]